MQSVGRIVIDLEDYLETIGEKHPTLIAVLSFVSVFVVLVAVIWFLLFSDLNASADFVYNQF